jgi:hypothetical protein
MLRKSARVVVCVALVAGSVVSQTGTAATGSASVTGTTFGLPGYMTWVGSLDFHSTGIASNSLTLSTVEVAQQLPCVNNPDPSCANRLPPQYVFADSSGDLVAASGPCRMTARGVATCAGEELGLYDDEGEPGVVPVAVVLGAGNDRFQAALPPLVAFSKGYEYVVDAGPGNDIIVLVDETPWGVPFAGPPSGLDDLFCGEGVDRAVVSRSVITHGCEFVSSVPVSSSAPPLNG